MPTEETLIETRQAKHQDANGGIYPLASDGSTIDSVLIEFDKYGEDSSLIPVTVDPNEVGGLTETLHGRLTTFRKSGALTFLRITDSTGSIQLIATKMHLANYTDLKSLDLGDIIEVIGKLAWSKTHERSVLVISWRLLSKAVRPPPEKFIGIQDTELKYRHRYLDLMSSEESRARFVVRSYIIKGIRNFMDRLHFLEVETSTLSSIASGANANPFVTKHKALDIDLRLRIAPELNLKRLLVGGMDRVYEIGRAYRNEGIDTRHNPEFTIMESYQAYGTFPELLSKTRYLLTDVDLYLKNELPRNILPFFLTWKEQRNFSWDFVEVPMSKAVELACIKAGISLSVTDSLMVRIDDMAHPNERLQKIDIKALFDFLDSGPHTVGNVISFLFEHVAEPFLVDDYRTDDGKYSRPVFITEHPKEISPLARSNDSNPLITDRFELYIDGRELANAFQELNDPMEQALRFQEQLVNNKKDPMAYDADYIQALEQGMPPAIGFGMGIDRLAMLLTGTTSIKDVILFPTLRPNNV